MSVLPQNGSVLNERFLGRWKKVAQFLMSVLPQNGSILNERL